jgi:transcriptional regulator with XRE-family HTH domain
VSGGIVASDPRIITFGRVVRAHREQRGLTQPQLAKLAGCDRVSISRVENATYDTLLPRILRLADALGVAPADLFDGIPANGDRSSTEETR